jgi:hypothetical protein
MLEPILDIEVFRALRQVGLDERKEERKMETKRQLAAKNIQKKLVSFIDGIGAVGLVLSEHIDEIPENYQQFLIRRTKVRGGVIAIGVKLRTLADFVIVRSTERYCGIMNDLGYSVFEGYRDC